MDNISEILGIVFFGNTIEKYCWFLGIILSGIIFRRLITRYAGRLIFRLFKNYSKETTAENFLDLLHKPFSLFILLIFVYIAFDQLSFPNYLNLVPKTEFGLKMVLEKSFEVIFMSTMIWIFLRIIDFIGLIMLLKAEKTESKQDNQIIPFIKESLKILAILLGIFVILGTVFQLNIGSLIAGLGIGGLAIALAAKESLENLLGSFTIFLDKPFTVGDMVKVGEITGVVEKIGFRSTRIRTLEKSFVTVPNKKMVDAELDNLTLRTFQRANFKIRLKIGTSTEKIQAIVSETQEYINTHEHTNQDGQVKFHEFGPNSYDIMVLYFVDSMDWPLYLSIKEEINYKIIEIVEKNSAEFASIPMNIDF
ncbi:MAG: mechanosensitive ion channel family protein [Bacteroidetes bacterium]|nr:mechanosensitive ion channel family protein [Bacteroidota bacterium]